MKRALLLLAAASLGAAACGGPQFRAHDAAAPLSLTEDSSGQRFDVAVGQEALVRLNANPSTGYRWSLADTHSAVMAVVGEPQFQPPARQIPGAPGVETWTLKAMAAGEGTVLFEYRRPWEKAQVPPARTVSITFLSR